MYTKEELIRQCFLKVHGGKVNPDSEITVMEADIEKYLGAAIPAVINEDVMGRKVMELRAKRVDIHQSFSDSAYYVSYKVDVKKDTVRDLFYVELPNNVTRLPSEAQIGDIYPLKGRPFQKAHSFSETTGLEETGTTYYWYENYSGVDRVYLRYHKSTVNEVIANVILDVDSLNNTDVVPLPDYLYSNLLEHCENYFLKMQAVPSDELNDARDES